MVMNAFSVWLLSIMFYDRMATNKINKLHERWLRIIYSNKSISYEELLKNETYASLLQKRSRLLETIPLE